MATDINLRRVAEFSELAETDITAILDAPTADAIRVLLKGIDKNANHCLQNKAKVQKLDVELEARVRQHESKEKVLKNTRDKALADLQKCRSELQTSESSRIQAESDLEQSNSNTSSEASEVSSLRSRVATLEASNRDTLALLESKNNSYDKLMQDLSAQHQRAAELRKQISALDHTVQSSSSSVTTSKLREQSLQQEVDSLKKHNEWLDNERRIKADEHTTFRKEKNARISELSRSNEQYISESEALQRSETTLKQRLEMQFNKFEDATQEHQRLGEEKLTQEQQFRAELESANRLAELHKESADTQRERVEELQNNLEEAQDDAAEEIGKIRAEAEADHADMEDALQKIPELEATITQLRSEIEEVRARPSTPQRTVQPNGTTTPARPSTPLGIFSPASVSRLKGTVSTTQMFAEYKRLEKDCAAEKRNNAELQSSLDNMVQELESNKPEIDELRADHSRLQTELVDMSGMIEQATQERDQSAKEARACYGRLHAQSKEIEVLSQQLRDAGSEIRYLLMEQHMRDQGGSLSREDMTQLQNGVDEALRQDVSNLSDTQQIVNRELIAFKSISDLQQQNENQLKTIRKLVEQLESQESKEREERLYNAEQELLDSREQVAKFQDELKSMVAQSKSFVKERDMLRNMLGRKGHLPHNLEASDFSRSMPIPAGGSPARGLDESLNGGSDYAKLLKDLQTHFDSYRQESATDTSSLKSQISDMTKRNSQLQTEFSRAAGNLSAAEQRHEMLQANYNMLKTENNELQKRSSAATENITKHELKVQQAAEELIEARGMLDSLRRESANLKAEKELWKSIEKRLIDDNEALRNDRSRADQMYSSLQSMMNERESDESESRRRLQGQVDSLENELQSTKRKLNDELEDNKKAFMRREYEHEQAQKRVDDLMTSLSSIREELASTKTSRDHLQARVDELTVELRSAEERLEVYTKPPEAPLEQAGDEESSASREQELALEVSELKRDLDLTKSELERTNEQIEVYKGISQASEERLQELAETNDQYREETEASIAEKDATTRNLEQRVRDIASELENTNSELSRLRNEQSNVDRKLEEQKATFETDIARLREQEERSSEEAKFNLEASKAQAQIAQEAQQNYETELVKHAEAAKALHTVRTDANQLRLDMVDLKTQAEGAQIDLQQKESSWGELKDRYEAELANIRQRREEATQQNTLLHGQLESLTQQIGALQRGRTATEEDNNPATSGSELERMQEVIKYLRKEKEIVDVQFHLSSQEAKRLRQQYDFSQSQLDDLRLKLDQQSRVSADSDRNAMSHSELMKSVNELNILRESNVTLRAESRQAQQSLTERNSRVEQLEAQIHPLQARVAELEHLVELRDGEYKLLEEDRNHWQQRTQNILSKYDRVDPAELEAMKEKLSALEVERDQAVTALDSLQTQVDDVPTQIEVARTDLKTKLTEQFKERDRKQRQKMQEKQNEVDAATSERDTLQKELDVVREQLESAHNHAATPQDVQMNGDAAPPPGEVTNDGGERLGQLEAQILELESAMANKDRQITDLQASRAEDANSQMEKFKQEAETAKQAALEELRQTLSAEHQQELEVLRAQSVPVSTEVSKPIEAAGAASPSTKIDEQPSDEALRNLDAARARFVIAHNLTVRGILTKNIQSAVEKSRAKLAAAPNADGDGVSDARAEQSTSSFDAQREALLKEKEAEFASEKEKLETEFAERLETEKKGLVQRHQEELSTQKLDFDQASEKKIAEQIATKEAMLQRQSDMKLGLVRNQANLAKAQLEVVKKAAEETPDKAVKEVWDVAKSAKPAPAPKPTPTAAPPAAPSAQAAGSNPAVQSTDEAVVKQEASEASQQRIAEPSTQSALPKAGTSSGSGSGATRQPSGIQQPAARRLSGLPTPRGAVPQTKLPQVSQAGAGRATGIPSGPGGRGQGRSRGAATNAQTRGGVSNSPGRGNLNPGASKFTPASAGAKRPREEGEGDSGAGKRIRGGGQAP